VTDARADAAPTLYPIQLAEVHCATIRADHRPKPDDSEHLQTAVQIALTELDAAARAFRVRLDVQIGVPAVGEGEIADLQVVVQGTFTAESEISAELYARYTAFTPVALLWPYARAYLSQLGSMVGLAIPPLPSLDVVSLGRSDEELAEEA
jgi:preprotein translocase subunit SecB